MIFVIRQHLSKTTKKHSPFSRLKNCIFKFFPIGIFSNYFIPTISTCPSLVAISPKKIHFFRFTFDVSESRYINTIGSTSRVIFIIKSINFSNCTSTQLMIHNVMA